MRVCFISSYPPNRARLSEYAQSLVRDLATRPRIQRIYVLADVVGGSTNRVAEGPKVEVLRVWRPDHVLSILRLVPAILRLRPDVVHFNVHFQSYGRSRLTNFLGLALIPLCQRLGLRVVATTHNFGEKVHLASVQVKPSVLNKLGIFVATKMLLSASRLAVTVRSYVAYLQRRYGYGRAVYIPHGAAVIQQPPLDPPERLVLMFGHMGPYKGLPTILKAFEAVVAEKPGVRLVIAGASHPNFPGYLEAYRRTYRPKVDFLGYVQEADLGTVFGTADVVVLPYLTATGTSGVFHMACSYGKPVIASDLPEIREMVREGAAALLVPPRDVTALKDAILKVLGNHGLATRMRAQNLAFARAERWSVVAGAFEHVYAELVHA